MNATATVPTPIVPTSTGVPAKGESLRWDLLALERTAVRPHTSAPLRLRGSFEFRAPPEIVFERITDPKLIAAWFGMVRGGQLDHAESVTPGAWGPGSKRTCQTLGMGDLHETILHYDAPYACVYNVKNIMMPVKNHAALMVVEPVGEGGSRLHWNQYFDFKGVVMRHIFPSMMVAMMNKGLANLVAELGGTPSKAVLL